jgi:hypothetical protein
MTDEQLAELEALAEKATPGPWEIDDWFGITNPDGDDVGCVDSRESAELIAASRTAIPSLIAEVKRLRAVVSDRASVIEECAAIADLVCKANFMERGGLLVDKIVPRIRALATPQEKDHG